MGFGSARSVFIPRTFLLESNDPLSTDLVEADFDPNVVALPDLPHPDHFLKSAAPLNLSLSSSFNQLPAYHRPNALLPSKSLLPRKQLEPQNQSSSDPTQSIDPATTVAQENSDFGNMSINGVDVGEAWNNIQQFMPPAFNLEAHEVPIVDPASDTYAAAGPYNWRGLFAQSLFFNVVENTFRSASDDQIRNMLAHKPFWHDWLASTKQFNMRRWNDGDDFLVNYVGHPMQGAVSGFIEIQNDPVGRQLEIGANRAYWKSRFQALVWATLYSAHSEISPIGEAGIGNEGGWTYPIVCKQKGCQSWHPGIHYTNNTGWVDFTITPTVGTLWLIAEDTLDRYISDRIQVGDRFNLMYMFLRGALNPSRSMANAMRFKAPWYRDFQHDPEIEDSYAVHLQPTEEEIVEAGPLRRISIAPNVHTMPFGSPGDPCVLCFGEPGLGIGVDIAFSRWLSASFAADRQGGLIPKRSVATASTTSYGFGLRLVHEGRTGSLSFAVRPGLITDVTVLPLELDPMRNTYFHPVQTENRAAVSLMLSNDYKISRALAVRYSVEDTIVRYRNAVQDPPGVGKPPYLSWLSKDEYTNKSNWSCQAGPVFHF
ncbi:hypothetical protein ACPOL_5698 [Acidisarcina polymorpha]|uniref:Uncharacterized protein n=1 Tax=Acidisarcina polymorpha TaxID=2211140 RepID=A0A2Z5G8B4_9BACT|nr:hypothetical protein ACPOL_5698 [Acidisarcina polymorpha]